MTTTYPDDADGMALQQLAEEGSDFNKPMDIDFQIAAADEEVAIQIADAVAVTGFRTEVFFDDDLVDVDRASEPWTCECSKVMLLTYEAVVSTQESLNEIAKPIGGYVDGWSTFGNAD